MLGPLLSYYSHSHRRILLFQGHRDDRQYSAQLAAQLDQQLLLGDQHHRRHQLQHAHLPHGRHPARAPLLLYSGE